MANRLSLKDKSEVGGMEGVVEAGGKQAGSI